MNRGVVVALGLALVVAESAVAQVGPVPTPQLPKPPELPVPLPEVPSVPVPSVPSVPVPSVPVPSVPAPPAANRLPVPAPQVPAVRVPRPAATASTRPAARAADSVSRAAPSGSGGRSGPSSRRAWGTRGGSLRAGPEPVPRACGRRAGGRGAARRRRGGGCRAGARPRGAARTAAGAAPSAAAAPDGRPLPRLPRRPAGARAPGARPADRASARGDRARARAWAAALDISARRVGRLERRGLRRLRGLCGGGVARGQSRRVWAPARLAGLGFARALMVAATVRQRRAGDRPARSSERDQDRGQGRAAVLVGRRLGWRGAELAAARGGRAADRRPRRSSQPRRRRHRPHAPAADPRSALRRAWRLARCVRRSQLRARGPRYPDLSTSRRCGVFFRPVPLKPTLGARLMARGDVRIAVTLACEECKRRNYQTNKSKRNNPDRISLRKYCRWCRQHTGHRETR